MNPVSQYLSEVRDIVDRLDAAAIERLVQALRALRARGGRLFMLGVGGSAANASHAVNDFRKIAGIECYAPTDNVSELTARQSISRYESPYSVRKNAPSLGNACRSAAAVPIGFTPS